MKIIVGTVVPAICLLDEINNVGFRNMDFQWSKGIRSELSKRGRALGVMLLQSFFLRFAFGLGGDV
jgi:hypothetical protein